MNTKDYTILGKAKKNMKCLNELATELDNIIGFLESYPPYFSDGKSMLTDLDITTGRKLLDKIKFGRLNK